MHEFHCVYESDEIVLREHLEAEYPPFPPRGAHNGYLTHLDLSPTSLHSTLRHFTSFPFTWPVYVPRPEYLQPARQKKTKWQWIVFSWRYLMARLFTPNSSDNCAI